MLRSGKEHLESLRDGRVIYVGGEKIDDVTRHPAFRMAAQTVAAIYAHFGLTLSAAARDAMRALQTQGAPAPARPAHHYALSDFGLTDDQVDERFGFR